MEIPSQYKATIELNIQGCRKGNISERVPLPPPKYGVASFNSSKPSYSTSFQYGSASFGGSKPSHPTNFQSSVPPYSEDTSHVSSAPPAPSSTYDSQTCEECVRDLETSPICRSSTQTKIKLYF